MLTIHTSRSATAVKAYYQSADYYIDGREQAGRWGGKAGQLLGLSGEVGWKEFEALADNLDPRTGKRLTARQNEERRVAYDFTFSAPKSVSLLWEFTRDGRIREAFEQSVDDTMRDIEAEAKTRVRKGEAEHDRATGNLAWAGFTHFETRPAKQDGLPDPQLHHHAVAFNVTWDDAEKRWKAGQFGDLLRDATYWEAAFHARLADRLAGLGYGIERAGRFWEVEGVPEETRQRFSRRTAEIETLAGELGVDDPAAKAKLGATSRLHKQKDLTHDDLRAYWMGRLTKADKAALTKAVRDANERPAVREDRTRDAVAYALDHCFERSSVMPEKRVLAEALRHGVGHVTLPGVAAEAARAGLFNAEIDGEKLASTRAVLNEESRMIAFAREGRGTMRQLGARPRAGGSLPAAMEDHATLSPDQQPLISIPTGKLKQADPLFQYSPDQQAMIRHVWQSRDRVTLVRGGAGTGKTTAMQAAIAGIDLPVTVLAPSAEASRGVLRREGFREADTLARFLLNARMQEKARGGVIWVDEAGLVGSRDMARLFDVAQRIDARLVLQGDAKQHASPARGAPLNVLRDYGGLKAAELTDIKRQKPGDYRDAVKLLEQGETSEAVGRLERLGWVFEVPGGERYQYLADTYLRTVAGGETALVVAPTHSEARRVTAAIRQGLKDAGRLGGERSVATLTDLNWTAAQLADAKRRGGEPGVVLGRYGAYREDETKLAPGDLIRLTAGGKTADGKHRVNNGTVYQVAGFTGEGGLVLGNGWTLGPEFRHFTHGYVATSHASQGRTVDRVLIAQSSESWAASSREQLYVSVSRGRKQAMIFTDDKAGLREAVARAEPKPAAHDLLRRTKGLAWRKAKLRARRAAERVIDRTRELIQSHQPEKERAYER